MARDGIPSWSYSHVDVPMTLIAWDRVHTLTPPVMAMDCTGADWDAAVVYSSTYTAVAVPAVMAVPAPTRTTARFVAVKAAPRADGRRERRRRKAAWRGRANERRLRKAEWSRPPGTTHHLKS